MGSNKSERDLQLASNVARELRFIVESASNPKIHQLQILHVLPKKGGAHYLVHFGPPQDREAYGISEQEAKAELDAAKGYIRSQLAEQLNLKRCPEVSFVADPLAWSQHFTPAE